MLDLIRLVLTEIRGMWRFRWLAMVVAWATCMIGWPLVYTLPNVYEANAQVFVDADSRLVEVMEEVGVAPGVGTAVFVVRQAMLARAQLKNVALDTGLSERAKTDEEFEDLILNLQDTIRITPGRYADAKNLYTISYMDNDREMAISVVDSLLDRFVQDVLERNDQGSQQAAGYLDDQLQYYGGKLSEVERKLAEFKKENLGLLPGDSGGIFERLTEEMDLLKRLRRDLSIEEDRRTALREQLKSENPNLPIGSTGIGGTEIPASPTETKIRELENKRANLLLTFTDRHPDVVAIGEQLEQLYAQRRAEVSFIASETSGIEGASNATNPVYQSVQIALNGSSVRIAEMRSEISQHEAVVRELNSQITTIPDVEAEFAQLNRDYDQYVLLYDQLLMQKERERMGEAGEEREIVTFNIIEPPAASLIPVAPRRVLLLLFVLCAGLGVGAGFAYLKHTSNPVFYDSGSLREATGRPVLGTIIRTWTEEHRARQTAGLVSFASVGVLLLVAFVLSVLLRDFGVDAMQQLIAQTR